MEYGTIIYLNGTSSSGKTSLALALQELLDVPYLHFSIDTFDLLVSRRQIQRGIYPAITTLEWGFTHCVAALAATGNNVIVDDVLAEPWDMPAGCASTTRELLTQRVTVLAPFVVCYVKVYCPLVELERREQARGDRIVGLARFQFERVHQHSQYDVEVDTSQESPEAGARHVLHALAHPPPVAAFTAMRERLAG